MHVENNMDSAGSAKPAIRSCKKCTHGNKVTVEFPVETFTFHAQWLHDARCDDGAARNAQTAICQQPIETVHVETVNVSGQGFDTTLDVTWDDGLSSKFPATWLKVMAPLVARLDSPRATDLPKKDPLPIGWLVSSLEIPEVSYHDIFQEPSNTEDTLSILDKILSPTSLGIIKVTDLPIPSLATEHTHHDNLITHVLKRLFTSVYIHPIRGPDQTFNVSSHSHDSTRRLGLPNYDTTQLLLPHSDHAFLEYPIQVMGFYGLEGASHNTWVSVPAALHTMRQEHSSLYPHLHRTPATTGRVSRFYGGVPLYQATVDVPLTSYPSGTEAVKEDDNEASSPGTLKHLRWHPNLTGSLLAPYVAYPSARLAYLEFQRILRRPTHQLELELRTGDLYVWDNFRLLHGREKVLETPRTGVGQTVPEQVVQDRYRGLCVELLTGWGVGEEWLVHMPIRQVREMVRLFKGGWYWVDG